MRSAVVTLVMLPVLWTASCSEKENPGRGGTLTAQLHGQVFVAAAKLAECTGDAAATDLWLGGYTFTNSLPITDGWQSRWAFETGASLAAMLDAKTCSDLYTALNFDTPPVPCTEEGRACSNDVAQVCRKMGDAMLRFDMDCTIADMQCREGRCILGTCSSDRCDGDSRVTCDANHEQQVYQCGALGLTCGNGGSGLQCIGKGQVCTTTDVDNPVVPKCDGSTLTWCLGGRMASIDCSKITDDRRGCSQAWLDAHTDVASADILDKYLAEACGQNGTDCVGGTSECDESLLKLCIDGYYEWEACQDFHTDGCSADGVFPGSASCKGFPETP